MDRFIEFLYYFNMLINEEYTGIDRTESRFFTYEVLECNHPQISINGIGLKEVMKPCLNKRSRGNIDYLILYFYDFIDISVGKQNFNNVKNRWIILSPGAEHSYGNISENWCHSWIHLSGNFFKNLLEENSIPLNTLLSSDISNYLEKLLISIHDEIYYYNKPLKRILKNSIENFILQISRTKEKSDDIPAKYCNIKQHLDFNYRDKLTLQKLAEFANCSVPHFCKMFKQYYKLSPNDYILTRRLSIAKNLLKTTDMRINEISYKVGYTDVYYFSKLFKKREGISPSGYKKNIESLIDSERVG